MTTSRPSEAPPDHCSKILQFAPAGTTCVFGLVVVTSLLVVALVSWPSALPPDQSRSGEFLIRNVAVVDVKLGRLAQRQDVALRAGTIASIRPHADGPTPQGVTVIDGTGRYLMPGLWDMHTHSNTFAPQYQHPLFVAHGVTAVRDMWGCLSQPDPFIACADDRKRWNQALRNGAGVSPRYIGQSSFQINGGN